MPERGIISTRLDALTSTDTFARSYFLGVLVDSVEDSNAQIAELVVTHPKKKRFD